MKGHNYQDHYDTLQHKELAKRLLVEDEKPAWQSRLEKSLMSPTKAIPRWIRSRRVWKRGSQDSVEIQLRRAEKWVARPLGPRPDCLGDRGLCGRRGHGVLGRGESGGRVG